MLGTISIFDTKFHDFISTKTEFVRIESTARCRISSSCFQSLDTMKVSIWSLGSVVLGSRICFSQLSADAAISPAKPSYKSDSSEVRFGCFDCRLPGQPYGKYRRNSSEMSTAKFDVGDWSGFEDDQAAAPLGAAEEVDSESKNVDEEEDLEFVRIMSFTPTTEYVTNLDRADGPELGFMGVNGEDDNLDEGGMGEEWSEWIGSEGDDHAAAKVIGEQSVEKQDDSFNFPLMMVIAVMILGFSVIFAFLIHSEQERVEREKEARLRWERMRGSTADTD
jgi:hypothetical protein